MPKEIDDIYAKPRSQLGLFEFNQQVVDVFPDMINRSVPGYATIINMTGVLAEKYAVTDTHCYDLGSSLGASSFAMASRLRETPCEIIGLDSSAAMYEACTARANDYPNLRFEQADILKYPLAKASVVVLNFTLQFIELEQRKQLLEKIYAQLVPGGMLLISEKIRFADAHLDELNINLHENFKRLNGYSELEIAQKRTALEKVLIPETLEQHKTRLSNLGFKSCDVWFQCFNFVSMIAIK